MLNGTIEATTVYKLDTFRKLTGLGAAGYREAKARGFKVRRPPGCKGAFVIGRDWLNYLDQHGDTPGTAGAAP